MATKNSLRPCPACGGTSIDTSQLQLETYPRWYVRCTTCISPCSVSGATREECVAKWNDLWCWREIDRLVSEMEQEEKVDMEHQTLVDSLLGLQHTHRAIQEAHAIEVASLKAKIKKLAEARVATPPVVPVEANTTIRAVPPSTKDDIDWKVRYDRIKDAYIHTRLEVSGSFGNWDYNTKRRVLENEISHEVGFEI